MRVLVVEDNERIAEAVRDVLCDAGFAVDRAGSREAMHRSLDAANYDILVLDLGLPDGDALDSLPAIMRSPVAPAVLVLTARGDVDSRIAGLDRGADDYLSKPFALEEVAARVRALARRPRTTSSLQFEAGNVVLDRASREVTVNGRPAEISRSERDLLEQLLRSRGRVVARSTLENALFSWDRDYSDNALQLQVHRLRRTLAREGATLTIHTVRGVGYRLRETD